MGRRKGKIDSMSNSILVKDKKQRKQRRGGETDTFLHTTDIHDGADYNRINFQSVTEQSNLEDFMFTAEMAGKDFTAERQNVQVISNPGQGVRLTAEDMVKIAEAQDTHKNLLQIPRRPHWDKTTTKEELTLAERDSFTNWRRQLKILEEKDHIAMTPYEKNLDFWRQLWRVIERSDVIVQIVDARNPLLFRCEDLEAYVAEIDSSKRCMLLINKADFLNEKQRELWVEFFNKAGITAVFFSALQEAEKFQETSEQAMEASGDADLYDEELSSDDEDEEDESEEEDSDDEDTEDSQDNKNLKTTPGSEDSTSNQIMKDESNLSINNLNISQRLGESAENEIEMVRSQQPSHCDNQLSSSQNKDSCNNTSSSEQTPCSSDINSASPSWPSSQYNIIQNSPKLVSTEELLDIFCKLAVPALEKGDRTERVIGMVGYPNVGKSSTINTILKEKKLAVSATPGRTKHLQTLFVDSDLVLCDCPGLVFPSFVATKAHLVVNGILPIDELRDHVGPTTLICDYIPRDVLEATYSIMIPRPSLDDVDAGRPPSAEELLGAYGSMRGFMTPRGVADRPRASRYILKDFVKGKLLYCNPPTGLSAPEFQDAERHQHLIDTRTIKKPAPQIKSEVDKEFFSKKEVKTHSAGVGGVKNFVRTDTLQQTALSASSVGIADSSSLAGSVSSLHSQAGVGKSWKKHNNQNKREKLRRLHRDLDVYD